MSDLEEENPFVIMTRLAELCTADIGREVLPGDIYGAAYFGWEYLEKRFGDDAGDIMATIIKELDGAT